MRENIRRETDPERDRETERQRDRETERVRDRERKREREREYGEESFNHGCMNHCSLLNPPTFEWREARGHGFFARLHTLLNFYNTFLNTVKSVFMYIYVYILFLILTTDFVKRCDRLLS